VDGVRVHYVDAGEAQPLVMIHGLTGSAQNWSRNIEFLARSVRVFALDLANMGQSGRAGGLDAGLSATADRVVAWMDAVGLGCVDIAAHSHGGAVAMMLRARHPRRVRSLILFAPANPFSRSTDGMVRLYSSVPGRFLARFAPRMPCLVHRIALGRMYGDPARIQPGCLEGYVDGLKIRGTMDHVLEIVRRFHDEMKALRTELTKLAGVPVLLVWGDRDRAVSMESGLRLHAELPESEWFLVRGAGHVPFEEMPEICNDLMLRWLGRMEQTGFRENPGLSERA
jgi:pimeloyl-ACP methyl ester carboxylesterase